MRTITKIAIAAIAIGLALVASPTTTAPLFEPNESVVILKDDDGHGTAFHIGNGVYLTAKHVTQNIKDGAIIQFEDGQTAFIEDIKSDPKEDISSFRSKKIDTKFSVNCNTPKTGENVRVIGHPTNDVFITSFGKISSSRETTNNGFTYIVSNVTVVPGNSGGPAINDKNQVIGLVSAVKTRGFSLTNFSYLVAPSKICEFISKNNLTI